MRPTTCVQSAASLVSTLTAAHHGRRRTIGVVDAQGHAQQVPNPGLSGLLPSDAARQTTPLVSYTEKRVTNAVDAVDVYRSPLPCEAHTFELTGYAHSLGKRF